MIPYFSFIAYSNTGKTTYLESLIAALKARGARVGVVKHDAHGFEIDREGKDSWRFAHAGADLVAVADGEKCAVMAYRPTPLKDILAQMRDVDLILVEGWHTEAKNAIVLYRSASGKGLKLDPQDCIAAVSDAPLNAGDTPVFPLNDPAPMVDFLLGLIADAAQ